MKRLERKKIGIFREFNKFLLTYMWAFLIMFLIILGLYHYGILSIENIACGSIEQDFCHIQYKAGHSGEFDERLHYVVGVSCVELCYPQCKYNNYNVSECNNSFYGKCSDGIIEECKNNMSKRWNIGEKSPFSLKPFCSLCSSFWNECQADEESRIRFDKECKCTKQGKVFNDSRAKKLINDYCATSTTKETYKEAYFNCSLKIRMNIEKFFDTVCFAGIEKKREIVFVNLTCGNESIFPFTYNSSFFNNISFDCSKDNKSIFIYADLVK